MTETLEGSNGYCMSISFLGIFRVYIFVAKKVRPGCIIGPARFDHFDVEWGCHVCWIRPYLWHVTSAEKHGFCYGGIP